MAVSLSRKNVLTTTTLEDKFADLRQSLESLVLDLGKIHEAGDRLDTVLEQLASDYPTCAGVLSRARSQAARLPDTHPVLVGMALVLTTPDQERETAVNVTAETRAEMADETRAAALTALATVIAARATALSGADETPRSAHASEARLRRRLRHLGLRLKKSRRSITHEDYRMWTVLDPIGNGIQFKADSHEETLDLVEGWMTEVHQCWLDGTPEEIAAIAYPCIPLLPELPSPGTIVRYAHRSTARGN